MAATPPPQNVPAEILVRLEDLIGRKNQFVREVQTWGAGPPKGGPNGDGRYPFTDATGFQQMVESPQAIAARIGTATHGAEFFGAIGDGQSHPARNYYLTLAACQAVYPFAVSLAQEMDFLAWQAMVNTEGSFICPLAHYKMCNSDPESHVILDYPAGVADIDGSHSVLDWSDFRAKATDQHMMPNWNFATADGWINSTAYDVEAGQIKLATFDTGAAVAIDDFDGTKPGGPYYNFGHIFELPAGRYRAVAEGTITRGVSYDHGNFNPPYAYMNFNSEYGPDRGGWPASDRYARLDVQLDPIDPVNTPVPFKGQFDFEVGPNAPPGYLVFKGGGYMNLRLTRLDIIPFVPNCAILNHRDHSPDHYFMPRRLRRVFLEGPGYRGGGWEGLTCSLWKSFASIDGNLTDWEQVRTVGFDTAVEFSDGAYLLVFTDCYIQGMRTAVYFGLGTVNAGENIKMYAGVCSSGEYIFDNPGSGEFSLFGTVTDYPGIGLCKNNAGIIRLIGTRHEQHIPYSPLPIWHCTTGYVSYTDCFVLLAGPVDGALAPLAELDTSGSSLEFNSTRVYNMSTASGVVSNGAGAIHFRGFMNSGNPNIGADLLSTNDSMDLLGGAGRFEPIQETGFINVDRSGIYLQGGMFTLRSPMIDRWNSDTIKVAPSTNYYRSGSRSLKVTKTSGRDENTGAQLQFLVPIPEQGNLMGRMYFLFPNALDRSKYPIADFPEGPLVYFRQFWMQVMSYDALGRPVYSTRAPFKGEGTLKVPLDGDPNWVKRRFSTMYEPASPNTDRIVKSPAWATHYMVAIDFQSVGEIEFYIDDFQMNFLG